MSILLDCKIANSRKSRHADRLTGYTAKMVVEQVKSGYEYARINRAISILIADFEMIKENKTYHNRFRLFDENTKARFPDSIEINVLELTKLHKADGTCLGDWLRFFRAKTEEEFMSVTETNPAIKEAWGVIKVLSGDERARALTEAREKARMDLESWLGDARYEGRQEGRQEGLLEGKTEVARNLLRRKTPVDVITEATGLTLEEVKRLATDL
jgi:predicted transposase/invertase (TIGR01784 family)